MNAMHQGRRRPSAVLRRADLPSIGFAILAAASLRAVVQAAPDPAAQGSTERGVVYERQATREETRRHALARIMPDLDPGPWHLLGPFDNTPRRGERDGMRRIIGPERGVDLAATFEGRFGRPVTWRTIDARGWEFIDFRRGLFDDERAAFDSVAFLYREVIASRPGIVEFEAGSDDGLHLWWNGDTVIDADVYRGFSASDHLVRLPVRAGRNTILVKVTQGVGDWSFQMQPRIDTRLLALLEYHLDRDFPDRPQLRYYRAMSLLEPAGVALEVGGLATDAHGRAYVATRRGDVWRIDGAMEDPPFDARFTRFASGLHEPLGAWWDGAGLRIAQRGELTRLVDEDDDGRADLYETVAAWPISGNYHEFAFGPEPDGSGTYWVTLNVAFCGSLGKSTVPWRGWALTVGADGILTPVCGGLRSPNGLGRNAAGEMFATDNQGDWVGTSKLMHLSPGDWHGHPAGDRWYPDAGFPPPRGEPSFKPPAVWFPHDRMGRSASDILLDDTGGHFGPFAGQLLVGDQFAATVMRVDLERVRGTWQGACFPLIDGLDCGVNRLAWLPDGSLLAGMTNRGWWSHGRRPWGVQRIVWTGDDPFDILTMRVRPDGFRLTFTMPVDRVRAADPAGYAFESFTHHRWEKYGSPEIDRRTLTVRSATVSDDGRTVDLRVDGLRRGFVHGCTLRGITSESGEAPLHGIAFYTLNELADELP